MGSEWYSDIQSLGVARWEALSKGKRFASYSWMAFGERVYADSPHGYTVLEGGSAAVSSLRSTEPLPVRTRVLRLLAAAWVARRPLVLCQMPVAGETGLLLGEEIPQREAALREVVAELKARLAEWRGSFLVFPYMPRTIAHSPAWGEEFVRVSLPPGTFLPIVWRDFEEYLFSRRNSVRKDYRLHTNRAARLGLITRISDQLPDLQSGLRLIRSVEQHHRSAHNPVVPRMIDAAPAVGGRWLLVEQDGRLVGCGLVLPDRGELLLTLLGLDRSIPQVYFALMYGAIQHAIDSGAAVLHGGGGAYHFKQRLGYRPAENVHIRVFANHPLLRWFGGLLARQEASRAATLWPGPTGSRPAGMQSGRG